MALFPLPGARHTSVFQPNEAIGRITPHQNCVRGKNSNKIAAIGLHYGTIASCNADDIEGTAIGVAAARPLAAAAAARGTALLRRHGAPQAADAGQWAPAGPAACQQSTRRRRAGSTSLPSTTPAPLQIYVPPHPLVKHWLAVLRTKQTPSSIFRAAASGERGSQCVPCVEHRSSATEGLPAAELGRILIYEAAREWLPTVDGQVETPLGVADATFVDIAQPIKVMRRRCQSVAARTHSSLASEPGPHPATRPTDTLAAYVLRFCHWPLCRATPAECPVPICHLNCDAHFCALLSSGCAHPACRAGAGGADLHGAAGQPDVPCGIRAQR